MTPMRLVVELPRQPTAASVARRHLKRLESGLSPPQRHDAALALSELVTNAYEHGRGRIRVRLEAVGPGMRAEVMDEGRGFMPGPLPAEWSWGGAGLLVVDRVTDRWGVDRGSSRVWFELGVT